MKGLLNIYKYNNLLISVKNNLINIKNKTPLILIIISFNFF